MFTCLSTKAIHLECVPSQSTADFLNCFKRFTVRRGCPQTILSDNASQFVIARKIVLLDCRFITAQAPWKGGVYERLIGLMKNVMKKSVGKGVLSDSEFENFVIRVESVLSTRTIVQLHDDSCDVLRPIDFLQPRLSMINENPFNLDGCKGSKKRDNTVSDMRKLFRRTEETLDKFWKLWKNEYLNCLRERIGKIHK